MGLRTGCKIGLGALMALGCTTVGPHEIQKADSFRRLGGMYLEREQPEAAIREYTHSLRIHPRGAEAHFGIGEAYRRKEMYEEAEKHFLKALRYDPSLLEARLNLGVLYIEQERWADAIRTNEILVANPVFTLPERALINLGWAEYRSGDLEAAEEHLREAVRENDRNVQAHLNLGAVLHDREDFVEAATALEEALAILADRPSEVFAEIEAQARFRLAQAYIRMGLPERAVEHLQVATERGGSSEWAERSRDYLQVIE